jgi:hypothetical protein
LLPHQHHDEVIESEHAITTTHTDGFVNFIKLMLDIDLGDGHMESFINSDGFDLATEMNICPSPTFLVQSFPALIQTDNTIIHECLYCDPVPILKRDVIAHLNYRGPPLFV